MEIVLKSFNELSNYELYQLLKLRSEVFVVEQNCPYLDTDDKDQNSFHLMFIQNSTVLAYARLLPKGLSYPEAPSIGRVVVCKEYRLTGLGKKLMREAIRRCKDYFNCEKIILSAQVYLKKFYEDFGFVAIGETYLEDNIPHIKMSKDA